MCCRDTRCSRLDGQASEDDRESVCVCVQALFITTQCASLYTHTHNFTHAHTQLTARGTEVNGVTQAGATWKPKLVQFPKAPPQMHACVSPLCVCVCFAPPFFKHRHGNRSRHKCRPSGQRSRDRPPVALTTKWKPDDDGVSSAQSVRLCAKWEGRGGVRRRQALL